MSSQAADRPVPVRGADINEKDIAAACRGVNDVLTETMQGEESQGRVIGPMPLRGQKGPDMFQALKVLQSAGLDGGLGLADQGDPIQRPSDLVKVCPNRSRKGVPAHRLRQG
ncbi:hypothetical protein AB4Z54_75620, partial [Streptomyces sp. MCAF7]